MKPTIEGSLRRIREHVNGLRNVSEFIERERILAWNSGDAFFADCLLRIGLAADNAVFLLEDVEKKAREILPLD